MNQTDGFTFTCYNFNAIRKIYIFHMPDSMVVSSKKVLFLVSLKLLLAVTLSSIFILLLQKSVTLIIRDQLENSINRSKTR